MRKISTIYNLAILGVFGFFFLRENVFAADPFSEKDKFAMTSGVPNAPTKWSELVCLIVKLTLDFIPYIVVIAVGAFFMGLIKYVGNGDNEEKRGEGRKMMIYGILGFFFMISFWGVVELFTKSFGINLLIPQFKSGGNAAFTCAAN